MAAHGVAADAARIGGVEVGFNQCRQFIDDVVVHAKVRGPRCPGGVEVEAGALAEVVGRVVGHVVAARAGVRGDYDQAVFGGVALCAGLGDEILFVAGQAGEPVEHRAGVCFCLRWQIHGEAHVAAQHLRRMLPDLLAAAEAAAVFNLFHVDTFPEKLSQK